MGDLLFVKSHPFLADGDPDATIGILDKVKQLEPTLLVPGYGPASTAGDIELMQAYIHDLRAMAASLVSQGKSAESAAELAIPTRYQDWDLAQFFPPNLRFMVGLHTAGS